MGEGGLAAIASKVDKLSSCQSVHVREQPMTNKWSIHSVAEHVSHVP